MAQSFLNQPNLVRGLRNNNPGNLVRTPGVPWKGELPDPDNQFARFESVPYGLRAMIIDVVGDIVFDGTDTLATLIAEYAPSSENDTAAYVATVANTMNIHPYDTLKTDKRSVESLIKAMISVELGKDAEKISQASYNDAFNILPNLTLSAMSQGAPTKKQSVTISIVAAVLITIVVFYYFK